METKRKRNISERYQADKGTKISPSVDRLINSYIRDGHAERFERRFAKKKNGEKRRAPNSRNSTKR